MIPHRPPGLHPARLLLIATVACQAAFAAEPAAVSLGEAVEATLAQQPGVEISRQQVLQSEGGFLSASGRFDWTLGSSWSHSRARTPTGRTFPAPSSGRAEVLVYGVGAAKEFRNGVTIAPQFKVVDARDSLSSPTPISQSDLSVKITVPLLRGAGPKAVGAQESAARAAADAQQQLARFQLDQYVFRTASAYWSCLAAQRDRDILADSARRSEEILSLVELLAGGGELDSATRDQARALVASRQAQSEEGELSFYQSRQALALAMGYSALRLAAGAPGVRGEFPVPMTAETIAPALGEKYVSEALSRRGDQLAAHLSTQAQAALLEGAKSNLKPRVDFALTVGFAGLDARPGRFRPGYALSNDLNGANAAGTFSLDWPTANRVARGGVISQRAAAEQARLSAVLSANTIAADVLVALETLRRVIAECALSQQATDAYGRSLAQTSEKMKAGEATLTELIDMEDRYAGARRSRNDTLRRYAITLAQLRLLTGTLSAAADQRAVFDTAVLTAVPTFTP